MARLVPFEVVVARHGPTVRRVCRALLSPADADDAWSETFLAALRAYPELPDTANVEAWLVTIAHRKSIDAVRANGRRARAGRALAGHAARVPAPGPEAGDDELLGALRALPPRQRQAVAYHYLADLPYGRVAEIIGGAPSAARRAAADGIASLRATLPVSARPGARRPRRTREERA